MKLLILSMSFLWLLSGCVDHASDPQPTIDAVFKAVKMYRQDHGEDPNSVETLEEMGYLTIDDDVKRFWSFSLVGTNPIGHIKATPTEPREGKFGHDVLMDIQNSRFGSQYPTPSDIK